MLDAKAIIANTNKNFCVFVFILFDVLQWIYIVGFLLIVRLLSNRQPQSILSRLTPFYTCRKQIFYPLCFNISSAAPKIPSMECSNTSPPCIKMVYGGRTGPSALNSIEDPCTKVPPAMIILSS